MKRYLFMTFFLCIGSLGLSAQEDTTSAAVKKGAAMFQYTYNCGCHNHPVNNYSGLNSLRARLANPKWNGMMGKDILFPQNPGGTPGAEKDVWLHENLPEQTGLFANGPLARNDEDTSERPVPTGRFDQNGEMQNADDADLADAYLSALGRGEIPIGPPVFVFFHMAGAVLTDESQRINVEMVADLAKHRNLYVRVTGAADAATGTLERNAAVAQVRAEYVAGILRERGLPDDQIEVRSVGGIEEYTPVTANRNCKVELFWM